MSNFNLRTPHAAVLIWNYDERLSANDSENIDSVSQIIINSLSLVSIVTTKEKSSPAGSCEVTLAPFKNWINSITPGSWMAVLAGNEPISPKDFKIANPNNFKFLGRVQSVRATVSLVDGARQTFYKVQCTEWCDIFNSTIYIDPVARDPNTSAIGNATRLQYEKYLQHYSIKSLFNPATNIDMLLKLLGESTRATAQAQSDTNLMLKPEVRYRFPKLVAIFLKLMSSNAQEDVGPEVASAIGENIINGSLMPKTRKKTKSKVNNAANTTNESFLNTDKYNGFTDNSVGLLKSDSILGSHSLWQLFNDNNNYILNELVTDIRWEDGKPKLTLYNRIKPFLIRDSFEGKEKINPKMISHFKNLRTIHIDRDLILSINIGNNWRDKVNFIEIQVDGSLLQGPLADQARAQQKLEAQSADPVAFSREGFRPMILSTSYYAPSSRDGGLDILGTNNWKYLLRQWFFDNHRMLNGAITFKGINEYIQVGDNIRFTTGVMSPSENTTSDDINNNEMYVLCHVESISHEIARSGESRSFTTTINFVRGVIVDKNNSIVTDGYLNLRDTDTSVSEERNTVHTISTSTENDPDVKVRGR